MKARLAEILLNDMDSHRFNASMNVRLHATPQYIKETDTSNTIPIFFNMPAANHPDNAPPVPPVRPDNDECCHSGCEPCIFDVYELEMERYRAALKTWEKNREDGIVRRKVAPRSSVK